MAGDAGMIKKIGAASMGWQEDFTEARRELSLAEEEYKIADSALARATTRLRDAQSRCARLFKERIDTVNGG